MPYYDYKCTNCNKLFEVRQSMTDQPLQFCLYCGKQTATRLVSAPAISFKGSGFYVNDYAMPNINTNKENEK